MILNFFQHNIGKLLLLAGTAFCAWLWFKSPSKQSNEKIILKIETIYVKYSGEKDIRQDYLNALIETPKKDIAKDFCVTTCLQIPKSFSFDQLVNFIKTHCLFDESITPQIKYGEELLDSKSWAKINEDFKKGTPVELSVLSYKKQGAYQVPTLIDVIHKLYCLKAAITNFFRNDSQPHKDRTIFF